MKQLFIVFLSSFIFANTGSLHLSATISDKDLNNQLDLLRQKYESKKRSLHKHFGFARMQRHTDNQLKRQITHETLMNIYEGLSASILFGIDPINHHKVSALYKALLVAQDGYAQSKNTKLYHQTQIIKALYHFESAKSLTTKEPTAAIKKFQEIISMLNNLKMYDKLSQTYMEIAQLYYQHKQYKQANTAIDKALSIIKKYSQDNAIASSKIYYIKADCLIKLRQYQEAKRYSDLSIATIQKHLPKSEHHLLIPNYINQAYIYYNHNKSLKQAQEYYRDVLSMINDNTIFPSMFHNLQ